LWRFGCTARRGHSPSDLGPIVRRRGAPEACGTPQSVAAWFAIERYPVNKSIPRALSISALIACLFACTFVSVSMAKEKPPENWDGLERRKVKGLDNVYVRPDVQFTPYKSVQLEPTSVEFQKNWAKSQDFNRRPSAEDMQKIKDKLSELMREGFTQELVKGGYTVVDAPADDTLLVRTAIINLFINAPDLQDAGITRSYTTSAGSMTLVLEARDGPSGQLLARVVDSRSDDQAGGSLMWTNSATNTADAKRMIAEWAKRLRQSLDKLNGKEGAK
jgi:hypothetical protein